MKLQWPVDVGPAATKSQAPLAFTLINKTHLEAELTCAPNGLNDFVVYGQDMSGLGESSREPRVVAVAPMVGSEAPIRVKPLSNPVPVVRAPILTASQSDREPRAMAEAPTESSEAPMRARLPPSTVPEVRAPISVASQSNREGERQIGVDPMLTVDSNSSR